MYNATGLTYSGMWGSVPEGSTLGRLNIAKLCP